MRTTCLRLLPETGTAWSSTHETGATGVLETPIFLAKIIVTNFNSQRTLVSTLRGAIILTIQP